MRRASFPVFDPELAAQDGAEGFAVRDLLNGFSRLPRREGAHVIRGEVVRRLEGQVRKEQHAASAVPELIPFAGLFHGKAVARFLTGKCDGAAHGHIAKAYVTVIALAAGRIIAYDKVRGKKAAVAARFPNIPEIRICEIGTIIASHCGPGTVAVFFLGDERLPDKG